MVTRQRLLSRDTAETLILVDMAVVLDEQQHGRTSRTVGKIKASELSEVKHPEHVHLVKDEAVMPTRWSDAMALLTCFL